MIGVMMVGMRLVRFVSRSYIEISHTQKRGQWIFDNMLPAK